MTLKVSQRSDIPMFRALDILREVNEREQKGQDIKRLEAGQPSFGAPQGALDYAAEMIVKDPRQGYTAAMGLVELRERIAGFYQGSYGVSLDPAQICVTTGSSCGLILALLSAFDAGDTVLLATPTYPAYRNMLKAFGLNVLEVPTTAEENYQPSAHWLSRIEDKFDGLIICSPSNPTGTMIEPDDLKELCEWCDAKGVRVISDEAYHGITYEESAQSAMAYSEHAISSNSFSKYFAMTGWRMGWLAVPEEMAVRIKNLSESLYVSPPTISQHVAYKIFDFKGALDDYVAHYRRNRDILLRELPKAGFTDLSQAKGAFYLYADIRNLTNNSVEFCQRMMDEAHVSATPGVDFDLERGHTTMRISYAGSEEDIIEACRRLQKWQKGE